MTALLSDPEIRLQEKLTAQAERMKKAPPPVGGKFKTKEEADYYHRYGRMMPTIKVDYGIPLPSKKRAGARKGEKRNPHVYPWHRMRVDGSFFVPNAKMAQMGTNIRIAYIRYGTHRRYSQRPWMENGVMGVRVWRTQ